MMIRNHSAIVYSGLFLILCMGVIIFISEKSLKSQDRMTGNSQNSLQNIPQSNSSAKKNTVQPNGNNNTAGQRTVFGSLASGSSSPSGSNITPISTSVTQISIVFKAPDGTTQTYTPPTIPPIDVTWGRYTNSKDNFSIDYPLNWQVFKITDSGHEGLAVFPPEADANNQYSPHIGLGVSSYYAMPSSNGGSVYPTSIIVDNVPGTLYTNGFQGNSYVASVFRYGDGYVGLASSVSSNEVLYVFAHMIYSLTLSQ